MQQSLFEKDNTPNYKAGLIASNAKKIISKEQQAFNKLTAKINSLQQKIESTTSTLQKINTHYHSQVSPKITELGKLKISLAHLLHGKRKMVKLTNVKNEKLNYTIYSLLEDAFSVIEPDKKAIELYNYYAPGASFEEEVNAQKSNAMDELSDMFYQQFGVKIDLSNVDENTDYEKLQQQFEEQMQNAEYKKPTGKGRKKTKKQLDKEAMEERKEAIKNKSLRSIYLSLAKMLHPDTVTDEGLKVEKEEMMKVVTLAYNQKNLMELLRLEMQWVNNHQDSLANLDKSTLDIYIDLLKDQAKDLQSQLQMLYLNPAYSRIAHYPLHSEEVALKYLDQDVKGYTLANKKVEDKITNLQSELYLKAIISSCIEDFYEEDENDMDMDFDTMMEIMLRKHG